MAGEAVTRGAPRGSGRRGCRSPAAGRLVAGLFCGLLAGAAAQASPTGPTVAHGSAHFARPDAATLDVTTTTPNAVINWQGFSIGAGETTRFTQPGASSAVLNRVTGSDPSSILGQLLSNGRVFLVNPSGIVFGEDAVVDTAGLVASTLGIGDDDFLAGRYRFAGGPEAGDIANRGLIESGAGGVFLLAPSIENSGVVRTDGGDLVLAAGRTVTLTSLDLDGLAVEVQAPEDEALNLGQLVAGRGAAGVFAGSIRNAGTVEANAVTVDEQGVVHLVAQADVTLEAGGKVAAEGPSGGDIRVESATGTTWVSGEVSARASEGAGGTVRLLGDRVGLEGAVVAASGPTGGGEVLVGGDVGGEGEVPAARSTYVSADSTVSADASADGDGGKVVVFAQGFANVQGRLSARGGPDGGDGGFVETSGRASLDVLHAPDTTAPNGDGGEWLIDPNDIEIVPGRGRAGIGGANPFESTGDSARIGVELIVDALSGGQTVRVETTESGANSEPGDIDLNAPLAIEATTGTNALVLDAHGDIVIGQPITDARGGAVLHLGLLAGEEILIAADVTLFDAYLGTEAGQRTVTMTDGATLTLDASEWEADHHAIHVGSPDHAIADGAAVETVVLRNGASLVGEGTWIIVGGGIVSFVGGDLADGGDGTLRIESGSMVEARSVTIGHQSGSRGSMTVTGAGSTLVTRGSDNGVVVGNDGNGTLHVLDGGLVDTLDFKVARGTGTGRAFIRGIAANGDRSRVIASPVNGKYTGIYANEGGFARVGGRAGSDGRLEILEGGLFRAVDDDDTYGPGFQLTRDKGSTGTLLIDGEGSSLEVIQSGPAGEFGPYATLGRRGRGVAVIRNGGSLLVRGEEAEVEVSRDGVNPDFPDPDAGPINQRSEVSILSGGRIEVDGARSYVVIGNRGPAADGVVTVSGPGSTLVTRGTDNRIIVGDEGSGTLEVLDGALVDTLSIRVAESGAGRLLVSGVAADGVRSRVIASPANGRHSGVFADFSSYARVGHLDGADGRLEIRDGGLLRVRDGDGTHGPLLDIARFKGSAGTVLIDGPGSSLEIIQDGPAVRDTPDVPDGPAAQLGRRGHGTTIIRNGGRLLIRGESAVALVSVDGIYERFPDSDTGPIEQPSAVIVESGGRIEIEGAGAELVIGDSGPAADGEVTVTGPDAVVDVSGTASRIVVGDDGATGVLETRDGGGVRYGELVVGANGSTNVTASAESQVLEQADEVTDEVLTAREPTAQEGAGDDREPEEEGEDDEDEEDTEEGAADGESGEADDEELQPCPT